MLLFIFTLMARCQ